jgi:hypothetical protein
MQLNELLKKKLFNLTIIRAVDKAQKGEQIKNSRLSEKL